MEVHPLINIAAYVLSALMCAAYGYIVWRDEVPIKSPPKIIALLMLAALFLLAIIRIIIIVIEELL